MFHGAVVESDLFLDLPLSTQALYFHLGMHADDDGFVNGPKQVARSVGCSTEDVERLVSENFLIRFDDVVVIRHWRMSNSLKNDRLKLPRYPEIAKKIYLSIDKLYTQKRPAGTKNLWAERKSTLFSKENEDEDGIQMESEWNPDGIPLESERIPRRKEKKGKEQKGKEWKRNEMNGEEPNRTDDGFRGESEDEEFAAAADTENFLCYMKGKLGKGVVLLSEEQVADLLERIGLDGFDYYVEKLADFILQKHVKIKNHYATILKWWQEDKGVLP